ncbi:MAG: lipopolysaccharide biosynthesis protein [Longimonas sp.]|uniref:lipopolysaccharide biosynthesis protein n=1 Tax=Longimonas sp. TaxID=2039626 RepID=UPI00335B53CF
MDSSWSNLRDRALRGVAWSAVQNWGSRLITFVVFAVLAQLLDPEAFGVLALAGTYIALLRVLVDQGFAAAIIQRDELEDGHLDTAFVVNLVGSVVLMLASLPLAAPIAALFDTPLLAPVIQALAPAFLLAALAGVQQALFERRMQYRVLAIREFVASLAGGVVGVSMALYGWGVWSLVGWFLAERTAAVVVLWTASPWRPGRTITRRHFVDLFSFGIHLVGSNLLDYVNRRADNLIIGYVLGPTALGFYDVAYKLYTAGVDLVTQTVSSVAFSAFSKLQHRRDQMRDAFYKGTQTASVVAFPAFLGAAAIAPSLIELVFGTQWVPESAHVFQVLALIGTLHALFYFNPAVLLACNKPSWRLALNAINAVANVVAYTIAVQFGIVAVAAAFVIRGYVLAPLELWMLRRLINVRIRTYLRNIAAPATAAVAMATGLVAARMTLLPDLAIGLWVTLAIGSGALLYTTLVWVLAPSLLRRLWALAAELWR